MAPRSRLVALALIVTAMLPGRAGAQNLAISLFERYVEQLRTQAGIPGMSAAIVQDGEIVWERGFGFADLEGSLPARPDTPYNIADITQTVTTTLLAICAERGTLFPGDPLRRWVPLAPDPPATLRQVLSHTSGPTGSFKYEPSRFATLTAVAEACTTQPYRLALADSILDPLAMVDAIPGRVLPAITADVEPLFDAARVERYTALLRRMAIPYKVDKRGRTRTEGTTTIDAATGLLASVRDLAKYDAALDRSDLVRAETMAETWTNVAVNGVLQPTTMGWFAQTYEGQRLIWHYGLVPDAYSALILKVPARRVTLILLANSDGLSADFALHDGDVTSSLFARTFLKLFL